MTHSALDALWRPYPDFIGPMGPPMILALRRPGYAEWLLAGPRFATQAASATDMGEAVILDDAPPTAPEIGTQFELFPLEAA